MPLTQHSVDGAKPREKDYELRDDEGRNHVKGLFLRVRAQGPERTDGKPRTGGSRTYYVQIGRGTKVKIGDASKLTLTAARQQAKEKLGLAMTGHDFKAERKAERTAKQQNLGGYLAEAYKEYAEANLATGAELIQRVKKAFPHLLNKPMAEINDGIDMARWRKERANVSLETQRRELTYLKAVLNHAVKAKLIPSHQLTHYRVKATTTDNDSAAKIRYLTDDEDKRLRQALRDRDAEIKQTRANGNKWREERGYDLLPTLSTYADHIEPLVLLAMNTGLRRGDLLNLRWSNIDLKRKQMTLVISKSSHARRKAGKRVDPVTLPLSPEAVEVLSKWQTQTTGELVFEGSSGKAITDIKKGFEALMKRAEIHDFRFHDLRHTFASKLAMAGIDINTIRELMTHSDIKMTLVYAHLSPDHKAAALDRAFGGRS